MSSLLLVLGVTSSNGKNRTLRNFRTPGRCPGEAYLNWTVQEVQRVGRAVVSTAWEWLSGHSIVSLIENRTWTWGQSVLAYPPPVSSPRTVEFLNPSVSSVVLPLVGRVASLPLSSTEILTFRLDSFVGARSVLSTLQILPGGPSGMMRRG